jgi:hypothetical protein
LAVAINLDCRAKNIKARKSYTILAIFFPIIVGIIYAVKRKALQKAFKVCGSCKNKVDGYANKCPFCGGYTLYEYKNPKAKLLSSISIALCVIGIICGVLSNIVSAPSYYKYIQNYISSSEDYDEDVDDIDSSYSGLYYDRNHIAYSNSSNVVFYDSDGNSYVIDEEGASYYCNETKQTYDCVCCYVDSDGYFCYIDDGSLSPVDDDPYAYVEYYDNDGNEDIVVENVTYQDKDGNKYYLAQYVSWTYSGSLCINGETVE